MSLSLIQILFYKLGLEKFSVIFVKNSIGLSMPIYIPQKACQTLRSQDIPSLGMIDFIKMNSTVHFYIYFYLYFILLLYIIIAVTIGTSLYAQHSERILKSL